MGTLALFKESGVKLLDQLPSDSRTEELLGNLLEEKKLLFLVPLLAIKSELWRQLEINPSPEAYLAWIQANVHPEHHTDPAFVYALQVYCFSLQFPKGLLLRWFVALYEADIIDENAFLQWK